MPMTALFIRHKALPGKRDEVRQVWEKHVPGHVAANAGHMAYFYCYDDGDPDTICVFQLYADRDGPKEFVNQPWYAAYEAEVAPLLSGQSDFRSATPYWLKEVAV